MSEAYRPGSYSVDAIGESSQCMLIVPSNGRCGSGRTIFASTCASTLQIRIRNKWGRRHVNGSFLAGGQRLAQSRGWYATVFFLGNTRHCRARGRTKARAVVLGGTRGRLGGRFGRGRQRRSLSLGLKAMVGA